MIYPGGEKEKQTINITTLGDALNYAEQDLKDRWRFYKERYLKNKNMTKEETVSRNIGLAF